MRRAVVSTASRLRGNQLCSRRISSLPMSHGHLRPAIVALLSDRARRASLGAAGRALVEGAV